jgi:hypothetical protein
MSIPKPAAPAKLVVGLFTSRKDLFEAIAKDVTTQFGPLDVVSPWFVFDQTTYYHKEMGSPLYRRLLVFKTLIDQKALADIKCATNAVETRYTHDNRRKVNLDPGYLLSERFVLATGKNFAHRIYLDRGIYADLTLVYQKGGFKCLPWTYPDYAHVDLRHFLELIRKKYSFDMQGNANA